MGKTKGPYNAEYPIGTLVKIRNKKSLEEFITSWKFHNKLVSEQLRLGGQIAEVERVGFYHGGDELYVLKGIVGVWHEENLELAPTSFEPI